MPKPTPQALDRFWSLIDPHVIHEDGEPDLTALTTALTGIPLEQLAEFDAVRLALMRDSYAFALWGAVYLINGGCSDDGFEYARSALLLRGRAVWEAALADPDSLAALVERDPDLELEFEDFMYTANEVYEARGGPQLPYAGIRYPELGEGWDFDDDDETQRRYPRLFAVLG